MSSSRREKLDALTEVVLYDPPRFGLVVCLSLATAVLEGVGLSFLLPVVERASDGRISGATDSGLIAIFETAYRLLGVPFSLEALLVGAGVAIGLRFGASVLTRYLRVQLVLDYVRSLKTDVFDGILASDLAFIDERGSDDLLNLLVTQTNYPANVLSSLLNAVERSLLALVYLALALAVEPLLTTVAVLVLGAITLVVRSSIGPAYDEGSRVSDANEAMQSHAQSGIQGFRDVRLFGLTDDISNRYADAVDDYTQAVVSLRVNQSLVSSLHRFAAAIAVLLMVYVALGWSGMSLGAVGVFLFAMLRLAPSVSNLHGTLYYIDGELPHLVETRRERAELKARRTPSSGDQPVPTPVKSIDIEDVSFHYADEEAGLQNVTLTANRGEFVAVVGESGAGKSTIVSLLARLYEADEGCVRVNGTPLRSMDADAWRRRIAVVRQNPYIFDESLRENVLVGCSNSDEETLHDACSMARVDEFVQTLPNGYETRLGDDGVRLSGGQKQRVAIARALARDPDVLLLDEATSNLDTGLEREILRAIREDDRDRIVLVITHRLERASEADRIYAIEDGRVTDSGRHSELVDGEGAYAALYSVGSS